MEKVLKTCAADGQTKTKAMSRWEDRQYSNNTITAWVAWTYVATCLASIAFQMQPRDGHHMRLLTNSWIQYKSNIKVLKRPVTDILQYLDFKLHLVESPGLDHREDKLLLSIFLTCTLTFMCLLMLKVQRSLGVFEGKQEDLISCDQQSLELNRKLVGWSIMHTGPGPWCISQMMCGERPDTFIEPELHINNVQEPLCLHIKQQTRAHFLFHR